MSPLAKFDQYTGEPLDRGRTTADDHAKLVARRVWRVVWALFALIGIACTSAVVLSLLGLWALFHGQ